ncbi:MAG: hypothetical protein V3U39_08615 [Acidimicrobiia bacterium]|jgi:hypothetical protein
MKWWTVVVSLRLQRSKREGQSARGRACIELSCLTLLETIVTMLGHNGFPLETEEVEVTTWIASSAERLLALQERLIDLPKLCERLCRAERLEAG